MWFRSKRARVLTALVVVILVGIFLPPYVTANRLRPRVAAAISNALGRKTTIGNITLRLLPQPGFDFENFVVEDDPAFSAEPMIRRSRSRRLPSAAPNRARVSLTSRRMTDGSTSSSARRRSRTRSARRTSRSGWPARTSGACVWKHGPSVPMRT